jgi:hypothetical protein
MCRIKFNCSNANAAICGDYYFLSNYIVRNKICIYIKILAPLMNEKNHHCMLCLLDCVSVIQRVGVEDVEGAEDKGGNRSISQGKSCLEAEGEGRNGRREQVTVLSVYFPGG